MITHSVVMPARNASRYVGEAVDSLLHQTVQSWELILVDDGSTDDTSARVADALSGRKLTVIRHDVSRGVGASLNSGIKQASGRFIVRLDADDVCFPNRLALIEQTFDARSDVQALHAGYVHIDENGERRSSPSIRYNPSGDAIRLALLLHNPICHPSVAIRSECAIQYSENILREDYGLWLDKFSDWEWGYIPEPLVQWRLHSSNQSLVNLAESAAQIVPKLQAAWANVGIDLSHRAVQEILAPESKELRPIGNDLLNPLYQWERLCRQNLEGTDQEWLRIQGLYWRRRLLGARNKHVPLGQKVSAAFPFFGSTGRSMIFDYLRQAANGRRRKK